MKKMIAFLAILAICLTCFAGCGDKNETAGSVESAQPTTESAGNNTDTAQDTTSVSGSDTALTIGGVSYSLTECNIFFAGTYYDFLNTYGDYAALFGLDTSTGMADLRNQSCDYSSDGTWYGYFMETTLSVMMQVQILRDYAAENGIQLSEEQRSSIAELFTDIDEIAAENGYDNGNAYLEAVFGQGVTQEKYQQYLELNSLADEAYMAYYDSLSFTDEQLAEHYAEMGYEEGENDYPVTAMRHVLIMAETDENGEYTEETIAAAHQRAEELYAEWLSGEKTEESFAALADTYTDDSSSLGYGGLYEDIYKDQMVEGINDWLFEESRAVGDTAVIDNNGSYVGTHIVYFVGKGELYSKMLAYDDLMDSAISEWFEAKMAECSIEYGAAFDSIGTI